jgi:hypothetical protein
MENTNKYWIYIDDERFPKTQGPWVIVRSLSELKSVIAKDGIPDMISFDHDLGENQPTGMDCVNWLIDQNIVLEKYNIHSANPVGSVNMQSKLDSWKTFNENK